MNIDPAEITTLQSSLTASWPRGWSGSLRRGFPATRAGKSSANFELWHEEDIARRDDLGSERVHKAKRVIDRCNQERNNFIEEMDQALVAALQPAESGVPRNSETPGMIIDRLSILALKEYHMREQTERRDVSESHRVACGEKLARIVRQRRDLTECLAELLAEVASGRRTFAVYYQFKMYNDPALNPQLYARR
jgi:hypothetical protein